MLSAGDSHCSALEPDVNALAKAALAQIDGEIKVPGLRAPVQVVRDTWGVPHITAQSADDLFFAQGYVMAQDRLWQMEMWRRAAEGTDGRDRRRRRRSRATAPRGC